MTQTVEVLLDLVDDVAAGAGIVGGEEVGVALGVVGGGKTAYRPIHPAAQSGDSVRGLTSHHIVGVSVHRAVPVGHRQRLTQGVDRQHILGQTAAGPGGGIGGGKRDILLSLSWSYLFIKSRMSPFCFLSGNGGGDSEVHPWPPGGMVP